MTITTLPCNNCLCFTCRKAGCREIGCDYCKTYQLESVKECAGYEGELKIG